MLKIAKQGPDYLLELFDETGAVTDTACGEFIDIVPYLDELGMSLMEMHSIEVSLSAGRGLSLQHYAEGACVLTDAERGVVLYADTAAVAAYLASRSAHRTNDLLRFAA